MGRALILVACLAVSRGAAHSQTTTAPEDPWKAIRFLTGEWVGESEGEPGKGSVKRSYRFVLHDRFIHENNVSTYPPQPKNPKGAMQ